MSTQVERIVIAGAGQAGATVAFGLRKAGFDGSITVIGDEAHLPYERPQLSKEMLNLEKGEHRPIRSQEDYEAQSIQLELGARLTRVDADGRQVLLDDGRKVGYDRLVIATGVKPRQLSGPFDHTGRACYLRTVEDARRLREDIRSGRPLAIIGGGVIGLEVAAAARAAGCHVTVIEAGERLMSRSVDEIASAYLDRAHRRDGVDIRYGASVVELGEDGQLKLSDGSVVPAQSLLVGIGVTPNTQGFEHLGITDTAGVLVDGHGRSPIGSIYATGDIASQPHGQGHGRIETWANAQDHALNLVKNLLGEEVPYQSPIWFWSDQGKINLQVVGNANQGKRFIRGDEHGDAFVVFRLDDERRVTGCTTINSPRDMAVARRWVKQGVRVDPQRLVDPVTPLRDCAI